MPYNLQNHKYYPLFLYLIGLTGILFFLNYFNYLGQPASGVHFWRQTDSISFAAYYYENGMHFFDPGTYAMNSGGNTHAVSEFPILYYFTAALWFVFGRHDIILKLIDSVIVFTGFYCLFRIAYKQIGNIYTALFLTFLLLSSSTLLFYTNNFLPDPPSLGFCLIGAYFFFQFTSKKTYKYFAWAMFFFTLSTLIKVSMAAFPLSVAGLYFFEKLFKIKINKLILFEGNAAKYLIPILLYMLIIACWVLWAMHYNNVNSSSLFLTEIKPYWNSTEFELYWVKDHVKNYWYAHYYFFTTMHVFMALGLFGLLNIKKWDRLNLFLLSFLVVGSLGYVLLFYRQLGSHDYYMIPIFVPLAFAIIFSFASFSKRYTFFKTSYFPAMGLLIITALSLNYACKKIESRSLMSAGKDINEQIFDITGKLENYGVPKNASIFSFPDKTPNGSLYYLQRKGYTNWNCYHKKDLKENLVNYVKQGIQYLVISNTDYYEFAGQSWYQTELVGQYKDIRMYKILSIDDTLKNGNN